MSKISSVNTIHKITYLDSVLANSIFADFRLPGHAKWVAMCYSAFVAPAAKRAIEIKQKYKMFGRSITETDVFEIIEREKIELHGDAGGYEQDAAFGQYDNGDFFIWISPDVDRKQRAELLLRSLASCLTWSDIYDGAPKYECLDDLHGDLFDAVMLTDCFRCILLGNETKAELTELLKIESYEEMDKTNAEVEAEEVLLSYVVILLSNLLEAKALPKTLRNVILAEINMIVFEDLPITDRKNIDANLRLLLAQEISEAKDAESTAVAA